MVTFTALLVHFSILIQCARLRRGERDLGVLDADPLLQTIPVGRHVVLEQRAPQTVYLKYRT